MPLGSTPTRADFPKSISIGTSPHHLPRVDRSPTLVVELGVAPVGRFPRGYGGPTMRVNPIGGVFSCAESGTGLESAIRVGSIPTGSWASRYATRAGWGCLGPQAGVGS